MLLPFLLLLQFLPDSNSMACDEQLRARYCPEGQETCLKCEIGPQCPVAGPRAGLLTSGDGLILLRGIQSADSRAQLLELLDAKRISESVTSCVPIFQWDDRLASAGQAWADQCALVEYDGRAAAPRKLHHDAHALRSASVNQDDKFERGPGVAQTVHWARTGAFGLREGALEDLVHADIAIADGLINGLVASAEENKITFGQATHVGCGWVQFPANASHGANQFENFMVCNYGIGQALKTSCSDEGDDEDGEGNNGTATGTSYITYYSAPSQIIQDIKTCLGAMTCRRRQLNLNQKEGNSSVDCTGRVENCLVAKSGLKFLQANKLRSVARSGDSPIDVEASKCKVDTILCSLADVGCAERLRRCLPLLDVLNNGDDNGVHPADNKRHLAECRCAEGLTLANGIRNDCSNTDEESGRKFCYVLKSPCVALEAGGKGLEVSEPAMELGGLVHKSFRACEERM